ncbi:MAG: GGDEF domain-containing protein [Pseudanabaenaceae cyanobacterium]
MPLSLLSELRQGRLGNRHCFDGVPDGETAWQSAIISPPHVVLSRQSLPDMSALVLCQRFKANVHYPHLHDVRFLTTVESPQLPTTAGALGVDDLLEWPPTLAVTEMRLQNALSVAAYHQHLQKVTGQLHLTHTLLTQLHHYDPGLRLFPRTALDRSLESLGQSTKSPMALLLLAVDSLAEMESTHGQDIGYRAVAAIAGRLQNQAAPHSLVYWFEPGLLACLWLGGVEVSEFAERLRHSIQDSPLAVQGLRLPLTLSIGIGWGVTPLPQEAITKARQALTQAQHQGGNQVVCLGERWPNS